jgi:hypothetical protein
MMQVGHGGRSAHPQAAPDHRADTAESYFDRVGIHETGSS